MAQEYIMTAGIRPHCRIGRPPRTNLVRLVREGMMRYFSNFRRLWNGQERQPKRSERIANDLLFSHGYDGGLSSGKILLRRGVYISRSCSCDLLAVGADCVR